MEDEESGTLSKGPPRSAGGEDEPARCCSLFGINRKTVDKMLVLSAPAPHGRIGRTFSRKLEGLTDFVDQILADDHSVHAKQQHTVVRIFELLRDERGFTGGKTIVREYVALQNRRTREVFVPLSHRPGHAQVDFGEADAIVDGLLVRHHYFCMDLPHSDVPLHCEAWLAALD